MTTIGAISGSIKRFKASRRRLPAYVEISAGEMKSLRAEVSFMVKDSPRSEFSVPIENFKILGVPVREQERAMTLKEYTEKYAEMLRS